MLSNNPTAPIEPELVLDDFSGKQGFVAAVDSAAEYADLIHDGFYQVSIGRHVVGRPFLANALRAEQDHFNGRISALLKQLGAKDVSKGKKTGPETLISRPVFAYVLFLQKRR
jgi:hypothetical protein